MTRNLIILFSAVLVIIGCSKDEDRPRATNLIIDFTHTVSSENLLIGSSCTESGQCYIDENGNMPCCNGEGLPYFPYTNSSGEKYNISRLNYLISNIRLHTSDGQQIELKEVHFVDADDAATLRLNTGELDNGTYSKISFTMGLDTSLNTPNRYVNPAGNPIQDIMWWPMPSDLYHYMKLEGEFDTIDNGYRTHTGPTMGMDMSFNNEFDLSINVNDNLGNITISVNMELNNWYQSPNEISFSSYGPPGQNGIMQNMMMQHKLEQNGESDVFTIITKIDR